MSKKVIYLVFIFIGCGLASSAQKKGGTSAERGQYVYQLVCLSCHMIDGGGVPHLNPPLIESSYVQGDKKKLIGIVLNGMTDRIAIDDEYYSNNMAPHADLNDQQIADVLTYVRSNFGNKAGPVKAAEVKQARVKKH
jgi:mono/diheme cytochrome c family protein